MIKLFLLLLLALPAIADNIGYAAAETPDFGSSNYVQEDILELFDEIVEQTYEICGDAGVTVAVKLRLTQGVINFKDTEVTIKGKSYILKPHEVNEEAIEHFYDMVSQKGRKYLEKVSNDNDLDALFYAKFKKSSLKNAIKKKKKNTTVVLTSLLYIPQSGTTTVGRVKINVEDLTTEPMYDLDIMQASITKEYLVMYEKALKAVQMNSDVRKNVPEPLKAVKNTKKEVEDKVAEVKKQAAKQEPLYDANW